MVTTRLPERIVNHSNKYNFKFPESLFFFHEKLLDQTVGEFSGSQSFRPKNQFGQFLTSSDNLCPFRTESFRPKKVVSPKVDTVSAKVNDVIFLWPKHI